MLCLFDIMNPQLKMIITMAHMRSILINQNATVKRCFHINTVLNKSQSARYRPKKRQFQALTYEMANGPHYIAARKSWNSWNTSNIKDGNRIAETTVEDIFIRNFVNGTWHGLFVSEIIIKRQHNIIRISGIVQRKLSPTKIYFLLGYTENLLSYWLHSIVKMELVTTKEKNDIVYKVI